MEIFRFNLFNNIDCFNYLLIQIFLSVKVFGIHCLILTDL